MNPANDMDHGLFIENILPNEEVGKYEDCLNFIKQFEDGSWQETDQDLQEVLSSATTVIENLEHLSKIFEFLGAIELGRTARDDLEIIEQFSNFEQKILKFKKFKHSAEQVKKQVIKHMIRPK